MTTNELAQELLKYPNKEVKIQLHNLLYNNSKFLEVVNIRDFPSALSIDVVKEEDVVKEIEYNG